MSAFEPGDAVEVRYLDGDAEIIGYRAIVRSPAQRAGDYIVSVTEVLDPEMHCKPGDLLAPILGAPGVTMRKVSAGDRTAAALNVVHQMRQRALTSTGLDRNTRLSELDLIEAALREGGHAG